MKLHSGQAARRGRAFLLSSTTVLISLAFTAGNATAQQAAALPNPAVQKPPTPAPAPSAQPAAKPTTPAAKAQTAQATTPAPAQAAKPTSWKPTTQPQRTVQARTPVRSAAVQAPASPPEDKALRAIAVSPGRSIPDTLAENGLAKAEIDSVMKTASAHLNAAGACVGQRKSAARCA